MREPKLGRSGGPTARRLRRILALLVAVTVSGGFGATTAWADSTGSIDHVETDQAELRLLYSLPGLADGVNPDPGSLQVTVNDRQVQATAARAGRTVRRATIMTIDVSQSMRGQRFVKAKQAATAFIETAPADVLVGIVTFAGEVQVVQEPTLDRARLTEVVDNLELSLQTRLYDGVLEAIDVLGDDGQRSLVVLSDGRDTSGTAVEDVTTAIRSSGVKADIVALQQSADAREPLAEMATVGGGTLLTADDPDAVVEVFSAEAAELARQVLVTVAVPNDLAGTEGTVRVSIEAGSEVYTDDAFVTLGRAAPTPSARPEVAGPREIAPPRFQVSRDLMLVGLGVLAIGALAVLLIALGVFSNGKQTLQDRVAAYSRRGGPGRVPGGTATDDSPGNRSSAALGVAEKALAGNKGLEVVLGGKLDAAGLTIKPAEWLLVHAGLAFGAGLFGFLLGSGGLILTLIFAAAGVVVPWIYLGMKKGRRRKAFDSHLPETLQLISGSLSAGLSLAQSVDTVVREGSEPIATEFRRALIEARLGVAMEDALESIATRMNSDDFAWVVMAIRIQREVGGNLAELLLSVAGTMREREYLRRQVKSLSAEGRLSGWIIGGLPPAFVVYLLLVNPDYLNPLVESFTGWALIGVMCLLMAVGAFWMSRVVKVEV